MDDPFKIGDRFDALLQRAENTTIESVYKALAVSYQKLEDEIRIKYQKYTTENLPNLTELQRSSLLLQDIKKLLDLIPPHLQETLDSNTRQLLNTAYTNGSALAQALVENIDPNFSILLPTIPVEAIEHAATNAMNWLQGASSAFRATASSVIQQGLIQNRGVNWTAGILRRTLAVTRREAEGIVRTASLQATDASTRQTYEANGIDYVSRVATADDRVCGYCAQRAGSIYRRGDTTATLHFRCRCYLMPIKPEWIKSGLVDLSWETSHYNSAIADCRTPPNSGLAQFEKAAGLARSPTPLWTPQEGFLNEGFAIAAGVSYSPKNQLPTLNELINSYHQQYLNQPKEELNALIIKNAKTYKQILAEEGEGVANESLNNFLLKIAERKAQTEFNKMKLALDEQEKILLNKNLQKLLQTAFKELYGNTILTLEDLKEVNPEAYDSLITRYEDKKRKEAQVRRKERASQKALNQQVKKRDDTFDKAPDNIKTIYGKYKFVDIVPPIKNRGPYYHPNQGINMDATPNREFAAIYRHEWGHHLDFKLGKISSSDAGKKAFTEDAERIKDNYKKSLHKLDDNEEGESSFLMLADTAAALSNNEIGFGHSEEYFSKPGNRETEVFANIISLVGSGDANLIETAKTIAPSVYQFIMSSIDEANHAN